MRSACNKRSYGGTVELGWLLPNLLSLVEFKSFEYQQSKLVVAGEDIKANILKFGIRKLERDTNVSHHTLEKVLRGESVRRKTLAKIMKQVSLYREGANSSYAQ